jgi:hypothetical protein
MAANSPKTKNRAAASSATADKKMTKATAIPIFKTIIALIILLVSYRYLAKIEMCKCGDKNDISNMEWVNVAFIVMNSVALILYIFFFALGTDYANIFRVVNLHLLLSLFAIYFIFVLYCLILFVTEFYHYYYTLPKGCNCGNGDISKYVFYVQGGIYTLNLTFIAGLMIYIVLKK